MPYAKFSRLLARESNETLIEYAGKKVKCAMSFVDIENRKPVNLRHSDYLVIHFDRDGKIDRGEADRGMRLAVDGLDFGMGVGEKNVLDVRPRIAQLKYREEFLWEPTREEAKLILDDIFDV